MEASRSWKDIASSEEDEAGPSQRSFQVVGLISKPMHGNGRTSSDRQFFYINGRPWEGGKVARAFNEVYKSYNSNQFPFVIADFRLPTDAYDVNVSPDKRTIFLHSEAQLVDALKVRVRAAHAQRWCGNKKADFIFDSFQTALDDFFAPSRGTFSVNGPSQPTRPTQTQSKLSHLIQSAPISDSSTNEQTSRQKRPIHNEHNEEGTDEEVVSDAENVEHPAKVARRAEFEEEVEGVEEEGHEAEEEEEAHEGLPAVRDLEMLSSSPPLPTVRMGPLPTPEAVLTVPPARSPPSSDHLLSSSEDEEDDEVMHEGPSQNNTILGNANSVRQRPTSLADSMRNGSGLSTRGLASSTRLFITPRWGASGSRNAPNATSRAARADLSDTLREFAMPGSQLGTLLVEQDSEGAEEEDENEEDEEVLDETARDDVPEDHLEQDDIEEENNKNVDPATLKVSQSQNLGCCSHDDGSGSSTSHAVAPNAGIADSSPPERERQPSENEERERHIAQLDEDPSTSLSTDIATTQAPQDEILSINQEGETVLPFSLSDLARRLARRAEKRRALDADPDEASPNEVGNGDDGDRALGEGISAAGVGVQDSEKVERELSRVIHKADFETMQIAGQFNLGFIIARRRQRIGGGGGGTSGGSTSDAAEEAAGEGQWMDDLFIVDQHAADEKYNFETLQAETRIRSQKLIR